MCYSIGDVLVIVYFRCHSKYGETIVVWNFLSVVEVPAAETTAIVTGVNTHTSASPVLITIEMSAQAATTSNDEGTVAENEAKSITASIDGTTYKSDGTASFATFPFTTVFTFQSTTLELSYTAREAQFTFDGSVSTEITIPPSHTHVTVNGVETAIDLPGLTTIIDVSESTSIAITLSDITTTMVVPEETYELVITAETINEINGSTYCGFNQDAAQTLGAGEKSSLCIPALSTVITLPTNAQALYLNAPGITTTFGIPAATTTFVPE